MIFMALTVQMVIFWDVTPLIRVVEITSVSEEHAICFFTGK